MIKVREVFTTKPGMASKFAKMMKEVMVMPGKVEVMTDLVGNYNTVVIEHEMASLADFEKMMAQHGKEMKAEDKQKMAGYTDMYLTGRREIYRILD